MKSPRPKKNPLLPTRLPLLPPGARSRTAIGLAAAAAEGRFALQVCDDCGTVQYPPREACHGCLSDRLAWRDVSRAGRLVAATTVRISADPYFRQRTPWRIGTVQLACGPIVIAHLHEAVEADSEVRMALHLDKSGQGVMLALPTDNAMDDRLRSEMSCDPKNRRVLVTDIRNGFGQAMARAFVAAGASTVFAGEADAWKPFPGQDQIGEGIEIVPLDVTDTQSVHRLAASLGGRVDILVNTGLHMRPGRHSGSAATACSRARKWRRRSSGRCAWRRHSGRPCGAGRRRAARRVCLGQSDLGAGARRRSGVRRNGGLTGGGVVAVAEPAP